MIAFPRSSLASANTEKISRYYMMTKSRFWSIPIGNLIILKNLCRLLSQNTRILGHQRRQTSPNQPKASRLFLFPQKEGTHRPGSSKQVCRKLPLPNGKHLLPKECPKKERLFDMHRLEGHIIICPSMYTSPHKSTFASNGEAKHLPFKALRLG